MLWTTSPTADMLISRILLNSWRASSPRPEGSLLPMKSKISFERKTSMPSRQNPRKYPLGRCGSVMAQERDLPVALRGDPIEMEDPARPDAGLVTVHRGLRSYQR